MERLWLRHRATEDASSNPIGETHWFSRRAISVSGHSVTAGQLGMEHRDR